MDINLSFLSQYNELDLMLLGVLVISIVVGLIRGVVREVLSVISWILAIYLALRFAPLVSDKYVKQLIENAYISYVVSFVALIIVSLIAIGLVNLLLSQLFKVTGLSFVNRLFGMVFGFIRGVILGSLAIWIIGLVPSWTKEKWFIDSTLVPQYYRVTDYAIQYLPKELVDFINKQKESPKLKDLKELAKEKGLSAISEQLENGEIDMKSDDVQKLLKEIVDMQKKEVARDSQSAPKYRTEKARPDENVNSIELESSPEGQLLDNPKPVINLESTD